MLVAAARLRPGRPRGARVHVRALERQGLPDPRGRRGDPAGDARRAPQPRHGGDRPHLLARARASRPPAIVATARTTRRSSTCSSSTDARGSSGSRTTEPWDAVLALEPEPRRMLEGDELDHALDGRRRLHRPEVAVHGRAQPPLRAARHRRGPRARAAGGRGHRTAAARRSCTTSAPPRCRTRSGTSRARSRGRSSTASSSTRC